MHVDRINMELPILYFKGLQVDISNLYLCISVVRICFCFFANSANPNKISYYVAFDLGLHCLPKYQKG